jgi:SAM-dependent methyltransferase
VTGEHVSERWAQWRRDIDLAEYHTRWTRLEVEGKATHGEADLIASFRPTSVLDAGCGMGRVAIELARRGVDVDGTDLDDDLLEYARYDAPHLTWVHGDLATVVLPRKYALVAMPGNVMVFCRPEDRAPIVANLAAHMEAGAVLIAGFMIEARPDAITLAEYDAICAAAELSLADRFATWERAPYDDGNYAVSVHRKD